jgi:CRISPR-associated exonuclease Cas4
MLKPESPLFTVTDLKQYAYCPRISYYQICLPHIRPTTVKMDLGQEAHQAERTKAGRRSLKLYGVPEGERQFEVELRSETLGLAGKLDELVTTPSERFPVDYKSADEVKSDHKLQLAAYALLIEEHYGGVVKRGFIYFLHERKAQEVKLTPKLKTAVREGVAHLWQMAERETKPAPVENRAKCFDCEFRRFCNDV